MRLKVKKDGIFQEVVFKGLQGDKGDQGEKGEDGLAIFPIGTFEISGEVTDLTKPYGHIERYGAKADYTLNSLSSGTDNTIYIQRAIDSIVRRGGGTVFIGQGYYRIDGTLLFNINTHQPLEIKGIDGKYISIYNHSVLVKNTDGDMFKVNLKSDGSTFNTVSGASGGQFNNKISNLAIVCQDTSKTVDGFNIFRARCDFENMYFEQINICINQKPQDTVSNNNYCDYSSYKKIFATKTKTQVLNLYYPDISVIEQVINSEYASTMTAFINVTGGGGFSINNCINTWQLNNYNGATTNALIKLTDVYGASIKDFYIERTQLTNAILLINSNNIIIDNVTEKYTGNNLIKIYNAINVSIRNIYRYSDITANCFDIMYVGTNNKNVKLENTHFVNYTGGTVRNILIDGTVPTT